MPESLLEEYVKHITLERGLSPNTCSAYASDLRQFLEYLQRARVEPLKASGDHVDEHLWELKSRRKIAAPSLLRKIEAIKSFYAFQAAEGRVEESPVSEFKSPRRAGRLPVVLSAEQVKKLLAAPGNGTFESLRATAMLELLYATGMRVSELVGLKADGIHLDDGWVRVIGKGSKERMIPIHAHVIATLRIYLTLRRERFEGKRCSPEAFLNRSGRALSRVQFWRDLNAQAKRAGLGIRLHPHMIRHTFATHMIQNGADLRSVQEMLGHASLTTTQIYTHLDRSGLKAAHQKTHPRQ